MKISSIGINNTVVNSNQQGNKNKNTNFKAKLYVEYNVDQYLLKQAANRLETESFKQAYKWLTTVKKRIDKLGKRLKGKLNPDTLIVLSVKDSAIRKVANSTKFNEDLDGELYIDGKPFVCPSEQENEISKYRKPIEFKLEPKMKTRELARAIGKIPLSVADYFIPW